MRSDGVEVAQNQKANIFGNGTHELGTGFSVHKGIISAVKRVVC
jgi:hypothetical protein